MNASPEVLRQHFLARIDQSGGDDPDFGLDLWRIVVTDPWYDEQLQRYASAVVRKMRGQEQDMEEVQQQARIVLQQKLAANPTLNVDRQRIDTTFEPWMRKIIYNTCWIAAEVVLAQTEHLTDKQLETAQPLRRVDAISNGINVKRALIQLPASQRTALTLKADRKKIKEIAQLMRLTERQVKYLLRLARQQMQRLLSSEKDDESD